MLAHPDPSVVGTPMPDADILQKVLSSPSGEVD